MSIKLMQRYPHARFGILLGVLIAALWVIPSASAESPPEQQRIVVLPPPSEPLTETGTQQIASAEGLSASAKKEKKHPIGLAPEQRCETGYCPQPPLLYHEKGPVQHSIKLYLVFWGEEWEIGGKTLELSLKSEFTHLSGTPWFSQMSQYFDESANIGTTYTTAIWHDNSVLEPRNVNDEKLRNEIEAAVKANGWTRETSAQFMILPSPGSTYEAGFASHACAYHSYDKFGTPYDFVPDIRDKPFSEGTCINFDPEKIPLHVTEMDATHEFAETATDPWVNAWYGEEGLTAENADICSSHDEVIYTAEETPFWGQALWDNNQHACSNSDPSPPHTYAHTLPATGVTAHTAVLHGEVNAEGTVSHEWFKWYHPFVHNTEKVEFTGRKMQSPSVELTGLQTGVPYVFEVCNENSTGSECGGQKTFTPK